MTGRLQLFTICTGLFVLSSCGSEAPTRQGFLPTTSFDALANEIPAWRACDHTQGYGCAFVRALGNPVRGTYEFKDIFSKCEFNAESALVSIVNSTATLPTFAITINLKQTDEGTQICDDGNSGKCHLTLSLHKAHAYSTTQDPCFVTIHSKNPLEAEVSCNALVSATGIIGVAAGSRFACPK
jgi:hypothetical protein